MLPEGHPHEISSLLSDPVDLVDPHFRNRCGNAKLKPGAAIDLYLFTSFRGNGDGLHLAWSADGLKWTALAGDRVLLDARGRREADARSLCSPESDGTFHMVWTSGWYERVIGYARSRDLIRWSDQKAIPVMEHEPAARNCWAPELVYDPAQRQYIIFWATTIPGRFPGDGCQRRQRAEP